MGGVGLAVRPVAGGPVHESEQAGGRQGVAAWPGCVAELWRRATLATRAVHGPA